MTPSSSAVSASTRPALRLVRAAGLGLLTALLVGCTATKSTVHFAKAEQALKEARDLEAEVWAPYMWTRANETMKKSREEWAYADYGAAEQLALEVAELAERAAQRAQENRTNGVLPGQMRALPTAVTAPPPAEDAAPDAQPEPVTNPTPTPWGG
jgi:hypothetical protein